MLHSAMDSLIKDLNANEAARLLILLDDRLTSLINAAEPDRDEKNGAEAAKPSPGEETKAASAMRRTSQREAAERSATVNHPGPQSEHPPRQAPTPSEVRTAPVAGEQSPEAPLIPSDPIVAVPLQPEARPRPGAELPSFEAMIASAARASVEKPQIEEPQPGPTLDATPNAPAAAEESSDGPKPADLPPPPTAPVVTPDVVDEESEEPSDDEPEWIEEDLEDGADLQEAIETEAPRQRLTERLLSRFRLPGLGRRQSADAARPEEANVEDDAAEVLAEDVAESFEEAGAAFPEPDVIADPRLRRLHAAADQLSTGQLLAEAALRTSNRIELRKVDGGLDLIVKGLPKPLGTVRLSEADGHVHYQPRFGLDNPNREPNRADLEIWMKAMADVVVRVLEDIGRRRNGGEAGSKKDEAS
ncbi:hypothetical protein LB518_23660 [Mesorhizobium sp. BR1-1-16]|uniref:hypothetical protein n=1 Tax=Mesorhizobium sp. BR1-1-16 TaxID=2876653 RepID=UPI001CCDA94B|nr:hypothetical protein [Mesorhizobium sp. BR1-1-16]MBZ9939309.1 hypothetical protein [Mesorhizobium sp. BR1-1-16]